jgi:predicted Zn-dependent protease
MAKKKQGTGAGGSKAGGKAGGKAAPLSREQVRMHVARAAVLAREGQAEQARVQLEALAAQHPSDVSVLEALVNLTYDTGDTLRYQEAATRLLAARGGRDADLVLAVGGAALQNGYLATALVQFRKALGLTPPPKAADGARDTLAKLEENLPQYLEAVHLPPGEQGLALALRHERVQHLVTLGRTRETREVARALHRDWPPLLAALNNLAHASWLDGDLAEAEWAHREVLAAQPDNVHALADLARLTFVLGREEEARALTARLVASTATASSRWTKVAEAHAALGDDRGVREALAAFEREGKSDFPQAQAMLLHLAATSALRMGEAGEARRLWKEALRVLPALDLARTHLQALEQPPTLRLLPHPFPLANWLPPARQQAVAARMKAATSAHARGQAAAALLQELPELRVALRVQLDRGSPEGVRLAITVGAPSGDAELLAALRTFALGERGNFHQRYLAAAALLETGHTKAEELLLWTGKGRQPLRWFNKAVQRTPLRTLPPEVERLAAEGVRLLQAGQGAQAEPVLRKALARAPEQPELLNNLIAAHFLQGRHEEGVREVEALHARWPDYLFGRALLSRLRARAGKAQEARALLAPLLELERLHFTEFIALCAAHAEVLIAEADTSAAAIWVDALATIAPEDPQVEELERRLQPTSLADALSTGPLLP